MKIVRFDYFKGVKIGSFRRNSVSEGVVELPAPKRVCISVKQSKGVLPTTIVSVGDAVKEGTVIAKSNQAFVHSSISGKVVEISKQPSIYGGVCDHIVIENNNQNQKEFLPAIAEKDRNPVNVLKRVFEAGIVDADGRPLFLKFLLNQEDKIKQLVVNCCTDEPYFTNNLFIMNVNPDSVIAGAKYIAQVLKTNRIKFVVLSKQLKRLKPFMARLSELYPEKNLKKAKDFFFEIAVVPTRYPVGDEKELVSVLTMKEMGYDQNPKDFGLVMVDVYTLLSVAKAVENGEPETTKVMTVVGADGNKTINIKAKVGTYFEDIKNAVRNNSPLPIKRIIAGGVMRGRAVSDLGKATTKCIKGIVFLNSKQVRDSKEIACTNCGECTKVCPRRLLPDEIEKCVMSEDFESAKKLGVQYCTGCGCCSFVCPSNRHLTQRLNYAKNKISSREV